MGTRLRSLPGRAGLLPAAALVTALLLPAVGASHGVVERATADRADDVVGPQIHVVYVVPSDGEDRALDTDGSLVASVHNWETWFAGQAGVALRLDTYLGDPDITFYRMHETNAQIAANGFRIRDVIEHELITEGLTRPVKIYAVYYDGTNDVPSDCGGGAWPPSLPGIVGAVYLKATYGAGFVCYTPSLSLNGIQIMDYAIVHELLHTLGFVPTCAPHHTRSGHVSDSPTDLMYAGDEPWYPQVLDVNHDDYFDAHVPGCLDLANSPYLASSAVDRLTLTIDDEGGTGTVTSSAAGIGCPPSCIADLAEGTTLVLTAHPAPSSRFVGWGGACAGPAPACTVTLDAAKTVTAIFGRRLYLILVHVGSRPSGRGTVVSRPSGIRCPDTCRHGFQSGTNATLTAKPKKGSRLLRWSGSCSGTRSTCRLPIDRDHAVTATFIAR